MELLRTFIDEAALKRKVDEIRPQLGPEVVSLEYRLGEDWSGDPTIFFQIVLTDEATRPEVLGKVTQPIKHQIDEKLDPLFTLGRLPAFRFRSNSENQRLNNQGWR